MTHAVWFRSDLRVHDNPALQAACDGDEPLIAYYFHTPGQHRQHHVGDTKLRFILETLVALRSDLLDLNIHLVALSANDYEASVDLLLEQCKAHQVTRVFCNQETELNERRRDRLARERLQQAGIGFQCLRDQMVLDPTKVLTNEEEPYRVFTPFKRAWIKQARRQQLQSCGTPKRQHTIKVASTSIDEILSWQQPTKANEHWSAGSREAQQRLQQFLNQRAEDYDARRDLPAVDGTSQLSPYLAVGAISLRHCLLDALAANRGEWDSGNQGILTWISELIWREFYKYLSWHYPDLSKGKSFNPKYEDLPWNQNEKHLRAWQQGRTGYPLVDAGMRQLNTLGWMHNRLRMVTAMFLTKQLFIHWHAGEAYFMQQLIDGDYAPNNGGWQWSASTGADAAPYFRVFNPTRQSERFDAGGDFIRHWVAELAEISGKAIHDPSPEEREQVGYPAPIVDHRSSVEAVKQAFKQAQATETS